MRTPNVIRPRKTGIMILGIVLLVLGIVVGALGLMGRSQADYYARKVKLSQGEFIEYATGKREVEPITEADYKGRNLTAAGKAKQTLNEQLAKVTELDRVIMPLRYPALIAGLILLAAGAWLLISHDVWPMVTVLAIIFYGAVTFAVYKLIPVTLSLSGIAGLLLTYLIVAAYKVEYIRIFQQYNIPAGYSDFNFWRALI